MTNVFIILIDGPMGSGKTSTSKLLNQKLPDTARVALPDIKRLVPNYRENEKTLGVTRDVMKAMINTYLEHGVSVIVEQITKTEGLETLREVAKKHGAKFYAYRLTASKELRFTRVQERTGEMMGVLELPQTKIDELAGYFEPNDTFYTENPLSSAESLDTQELNLDEITETIIERLS